MITPNITSWWFQMVSTHLKNMSQNGFIFPKIVVEKQKNILYKPPPNMINNCSGASEILEPSSTCC